MPKILIVDDQADIRELLSDILSDEGYDIIQASNASSAMKKFEEVCPSLVILDIWLEGSEMDGIGLLKRFKSIEATTPIIMISGHGNIETAIQTIKLGAYDFIEKPFKAEKLLLLVRRAIELATLKEEIKTLQGSSELLNLSGKSKAITSVMEIAKLTAQSNSRVMVTGEAGTGKQILARLIHKSSARRDMPYVTLHAQKTRLEEIEKELFGIDDNNKFMLGKLEKANGGTLYIDEVNNLPANCQAMLLKFLQEKSFHRIGSDAQIKSDVRIICSSIHDLTQTGFNQSLFYRLNVAPIYLPPLRERKEDLELIIEDLMAQLEIATGTPRLTFAPEAFAHLQSYNWPGNIRQLKNVLEWLMILKSKSNGDVTLDDLPKDISGKPGNSAKLHQEMILKPLKLAREDFERDYLEAQLSRFSGNISKTADFVGMDRTTLHRKLKSLKVANS